VDRALLVANLERRYLVASFPERVKQGKAPMARDTYQVGHVFPNQVLRDNFSAGQLHKFSSWMYAIP
jgi:hypothetical protein